MQPYQMDLWALMKVSRIYEAESLGRSFFQSIDLFIFGTVTDEERNRRLVTYGWRGIAPSYHLDYDLERRNIR